MEIKTEDLEKLEKAFFENLVMVDMEYGGVGLAPKRPFGNGDVEGDILEDILGQEPEGDDGDEECWSSKQREYAAALYQGLIEHLQNKYCN